MKRKIALLLAFCLLSYMVFMALADETVENTDNETDLHVMSEAAIDVVDDESMIVDVEDIEGIQLEIEESDIGELEIDDSVFRESEFQDEELDEEKTDDEADDYVEVSKDNAATSGVPKKLTMGLKQSFTLDPSKIAKGKKITYESSKPTVASVNKKGVITAKKKGTADITLTAEKKKIATCQVTVVAAPNKVTLAVKSISLGVKENYQIVPKLPKKTMASFSYASKKKAIASVSKTGVVKGLKAGKTTITVKTHNNKTVKLTVNVKKAPDKVALSEKNVTLNKNETLQLTATLPKGTASNKLIWTSDKKKVATVDNQGVVTAIGKGKAKITVKTYNGKTASCVVTVVAPSFKDFVIKDGVIKGYIGKGGDIVIPAEDGKGNPITEIGKAAFKDNKNITSVVISKGIEKIGASAFQGCAALVSIRFSNSITSFGEAAFSKCPKLEMLDSF